MDSSNTRSIDGSTEVSIPVPWGHIAGKAWNDPRGIPVLLLHGKSDNAGTFETLVPLLPQNFFYVAIDFPGHGRSSHFPPGTSLKLQDMVFAVDKVVHFFRWDKVILFGQCMGGYVSYFYSAVFPHRVSKLIALDTSIPANGPEFCVGDMLLAYRELNLLDRQPKKGLTFDEAVRLTRTLHYEPVSDNTIKIWAKRAFLQNPDGYVLSWDRRLKHIERIRLIGDQNLTFLKEIRCPILQIVMSESNPRIFKRWGHYEPVKEFLDRLLGDRHSYVVAKGSHYSWIDFPEQISGIVSRFLADIKCAL